MEEFFVVAVCLLLNALFASYEMAFVTVTKAEVRKLAKTGNHDAQRILRLRENPERTLSVLQIGITLVGIISAAVGGAGAEESFSPYFERTLGVTENLAEAIAIVVVVVPLTYLNVVIGELVPKTLALRNPIKIALMGAKTLTAADRVLNPFVNILEWSTKKILRIFFRRASEPVPSQSETVEIAQLSPQTKQYVWNLVNTENKRIWDVMMSWERVDFINASDPYEQVAAKIIASGHTRLPVVTEGKIVGVLHTKEFQALAATGSTTWQSIVRPALAVGGGDPVLRVLRLMQEKRSHLVVVNSIDSKPVGIVTLEDIIEEVVGDIFDEDDDGRIRKVLASNPKLRSLIPRP
ncbi:MAG TPA: hemolysin family protein [Bdellovibrionales bacterium]|nr:hemolysin family protein [Bdellovibrionales bacterium]